jgi:nitric oxide reductase NorE protein
MGWRGMPTASGNKASAHVNHIPCEAGLWVLIIGDLIVFTTFFVTFLYYRSVSIDVFIASSNTLNRGYGLLNTITLLTSSLLVALGVLRFRKEQYLVAARLFLSGAFCGLSFAVVKFFEYGEKIKAGIGPSTDMFFTLYFVMTAIHLLHVFIGTAVLIYIGNKSLQNAKNRASVALIEGGACFWHLVDLLWIVLFPLFYLLR